MTHHELCSAVIWEPRGWHQGTCSRRGVVERDGKWWCRQHDPVAVAKRRVESDARMRAQWAIDNRRYARQRLAYEIAECACRVMRQQATMEDLEKLVVEYEANLEPTT